MEQAGLARKDIAPYLGGKSKVSEILSGKRELTLSAIRALHHHMGIPAEVLIRRPVEPLPSSLKESAMEETFFHGNRNLAIRLASLLRVTLLFASCDIIVSWLFPNSPPPAASVPRAPTISVAAGDGQVTLSWSAID
jgi:hypothetical protein